MRKPRPAIANTSSISRTAWPAVRDVVICRKREGKMLNRIIASAVLLAAFLVCISGLQSIADPVHEPLRSSIVPQAGAEDISKSLVGTWRLSSFSMLTLETNEVSRPFGGNPIGYLQYSPGGHMVVFLSAGEMPKVSPPFSEADQAAIYGKMIGAYAGTYSVDGNKVTHH